MGLLSRFARGAERFGVGYSDELVNRFRPGMSNPASPLAGSAIGSLVGAGAGAMNDPADPLHGAIEGAGMGAGVGLGAGLAGGIAGAGARGFAAAVRDTPDYLARLIIRNVSQKDWQPAVEEVARNYGDDTAAAVADFLRVEMKRAPTMAPPVARAPGYDLPAVSPAPEAPVFNPIVDPLSQGAVKTPATRKRRARKSA